MLKDKQTEFIEKFTVWAKRQQIVSGAVLVGSWARGSARPDSDIDLVIVTKDPDQLLENDAWIHEMGTTTRISREDFGRVQSLRAVYDDGCEVEFGITTPEWLKTDPLDDGTRRVMTDGYRIIDDKDRVFDRFVVRSGINAYDRAPS